MKSVGVLMIPSLTKKFETFPLRSGRKSYLILIPEHIVKKLVVIELLLHPFHNVQNCQILSK